MNAENSKNEDLISKTLFFSSLKENEFDYTLPIKKSLARFCKEQREEASPNLFEYLCYKIVKKKIAENKINQETAIISEKFLTSKNCKVNIIKSNSVQKKFIFIPIRHSITHKWNAIIFVHLERQIKQYMNKSNDEPIVAKIISSNINSEEDDYILNTTMDKIENAFNFTSPEDIQFEVDSINISDQPNTSIFLLNFIEGLISQENNTESVMNYIMKLYDESSNTNIIGVNNYFISFNRENEIFNDLIPNYQNELKNYVKIKNHINLDENFNGGNIFDFIQFEGDEEEDIDSEEAALKIIAKENEEARKQMEEQELFFANKINGNFKFNMEEFNNMRNKNMLGQIQEVENESDDDSEQKSKLNNLNNQNNNSLIKKEDITNMTNLDYTENIDNDYNLEDEQNNDFNIEDIKSNQELKASITNGKIVDSDNENGINEEKRKNINDINKNGSNKNIFNKKDLKKKEEEKNNKGNPENNINKNDKNQNIINNDFNNIYLSNKESEKYKKKKINEIDNKEQGILQTKNEQENQNILQNNKTNNKEIKNNKGNRKNNLNNNILINTNNINNQKININNKEIKSNNDNNQNSFKNRENYDNIEINKMNTPKSMTNNIASLNNNLKKIKNDIINNFKNELNNNNKIPYRGSYHFINDSTEKMNILNNSENKNDNILSKSLSNVNPSLLSDNIIEKANDIQNSVTLFSGSGNNYNNCQFYISQNNNIKVTSQKITNLNSNNNRYNNENSNKSNIPNYNNPKDLKKVNQNYDNNMKNLNYLNNKNIQNNNNKLGNKYINSNLKNNFIQNNYSNKNIISSKDDNFIVNDNNNLIYESSQNSNNFFSKKINTDFIANINENKYKNGNNKVGGMKNPKQNLSLGKNYPNIVNSNINESDFNQYKKNTIIINETSNNNTVINFIEIKNNYDSNAIKNINDKIINNTQNNINTNNKYNMNYSNKSKKNYIKNELNTSEDNEYFSHIPEDGIINSISQTFSPNKTFSAINNQENFYNTIPNMNNNEYEQFISNNINNNDIKSSVNARSEPLPDKEEDGNININFNNTYITEYTNKMKTYSDKNSKNSKLTLLDNFLYGKEFLNSEIYKNKEKKDNKNSPLSDNQNISNIEKNIDENNISHKDSKMVKSVNNININENSIYNLNLDDDNKNDNNMNSNEIGSPILRRTTIKRRHRGGPEKNRINSNINNNYEGIDFMKEYGSYDDCTLNISKDLKCGCTGNFEEGCLIF